MCPFLFCLSSLDVLIWLELFALIYFTLFSSFLLSWEYRCKRARKISTYMHTHTWIDESPSTPGLLFHGGPRTESWVQCLLDESFPSTSPRNHHHRFSRRSLLVPSSRSLLFYLSCPIPNPESFRRALITFLKTILIRQRNSNFQ